MRLQRQLTRPTNVIEAGAGYVSQDSFKFGEYNGLFDRGLFGIFNLGLGIKDKKDKYKFTFLVNNLFDKSYATGLANNWANGTWSSKAPNPVVVVNTTQWTPARDYQRYFAMRADFSF